MSDYRSYKGVLKYQMNLFGISIEDFCKNFMNNENYTELPSYYNTWEEYFNDEFYNKFIILDNKLFKIELEEIDPYNNICLINKIDKDNYSFFTKFYDGTTYLKEMIEDNFK